MLQRDAISLANIRDQRTARCPIPITKWNMKCDPRWVFSDR